MLIVVSSWITILALVHTVSCAFIDTPNDFTIRLVSGTLVSGRVEIGHNGSYGTLCDDYYTESVARVICRQLGLTGGTKMYFGPGHSEQPIVLDDLECEGHESSIGQCRHAPWMQTDCAHTEDMGVQCDELRILSNNGATSGRVQIVSRDRWADVCWMDDNGEAAHVVCKQIGMYGGSFVRRSQPSSDSLTWVDNIQCSGSESELSHCNNYNYSVTNVHHSCSENNNSYLELECIAVRLIGPRRHSGVVEIYVDNSWAYVCDDYVNVQTTNVICRQLGYSQGTRSNNIITSGFPRDIILDDVICNGHESSVMECRHQPIGIHDCDNSEILQVTCAQLQLVDGDDISGILQIADVQIANSHRYETFSVCGDAFTDHAARLVCEKLGLFGGTTSLSTIPSQREGVRYYHVTCEGDEGSVHDCESHYSDICHSGHLASVICVPIRLQGGSNQHSGQVAVYKDSVWQTVLVMDSCVNDAIANVVCTHLGLFNGKLLQKSASTDSSSMTWRVNSTCLGDEERMIDCARACQTSDQYVLLQVQCSAARVQGPPVVDVPGGLVSIYDAKWLLCSKDSQLYQHGINAQVLCRDMGMYGGQFYTQERRSTNLNRGHCSIKCSGWEATIGQCLYDVITGVDVGVQQHPAPPRGLDSSNLEDVEHGFHNETLMGCDTYRLFSGTTHYSGIVQHYMDGHWYTLCAQGFTNLMARNICTRLGFLGRGKFSKVSVRSHSNTVILSTCSLSMYFNTCAQRMSTQQCDERVYLKCAQVGFSSLATASQSSSLSIYGTLQLIKDASRMQLSLRHHSDEISSSVYIDGIDKLSIVACHEMGFSGGRVVADRYDVLDYRQPVYMDADSIECTGSEGEVNDCKHGRPSGSGNQNRSALVIQCSLFGYSSILPDRHVVVYLLQPDASAVNIQWTWIPVCADNITVREKDYISTSLTTASDTQLEFEESSDYDNHLVDRTMNISCDTSMHPQNCDVTLTAKCSSLLLIKWHEIEVTIGTSITDFTTASIPVVSNSTTSSCQQCPVLYTCIAVLICVVILIGVSLMCYFIQKRKNLCGSKSFVDKLERRFRAAPVTSQERRTSSDA